MQVDFHGSSHATVGIEWELALVDSSTLELTPAAAGLLEALDAPEKGPVRREYLQNMVELVSSPHDRVADAVHELVELLARVRRVADAQDVVLMGSGCHPFSRAGGQKPFSSPRYDVVTERNQWWGRRMAICGMHVHVGVPDERRALPVTNGLVRFYPLFLALSASSPFWEDEDTGYASQRTMLFQQLPTNGLPWPMTRWSQFEDYAEELMACGMVSTPSEIRWDVRPSPQFGTVENRIADSVPTQAELGAVAALTQCLSEYIVRGLEMPREMASLSPWLVRENKWRAARYGLDAEIITPDPRHRVRPLREDLAEWLERLTPVAHELGCLDELARAAELAERGPSYRRQRELGGREGTAAVARQLIAETGAPAPDWAGCQGRS